jgi:hypothetical protein
MATSITYCSVELQDSGILYGKYVDKEHEVENILWWHFLHNKFNDRIAMVIHENTMHHVKMELILK